MRASKLASTREEIRLRWQKEIHHCGVNDGMLEGQVTVAALQSPACHQAPNPNTRLQQKPAEYMQTPTDKGIPPLLQALFNSHYLRTKWLRTCGCKAASLWGCSGVDAGAAWHREWHDGAQSTSEPSMRRRVGRLGRRPRKDSALLLPPQRKMRFSGGRRHPRHARLLAR